MADEAHLKPGILWVLSHLNFPTTGWNRHKNSVMYRFGPELVMIYPSYLPTEDLNLLGILSLEKRGFPEKIISTSKFT